MTTVLVLGATGSIGRPVVDEALKRGCTVKAITRSLLWWVSTSLGWRWVRVGADRGGVAA